MQTIERTSTIRHCQTGIRPPFICGNKLDIKWISANKPEVLAERLDIPWHSELYAIENAMMVHLNNVINQYIHGDDEPTDLLLSPRP